MNRSWYIAVLLITVVLVSSSCRSRKNKPGRVVTIGGDSAVITETEQQKLERYAFSYNYLTLKGTVKMENQETDQKANMIIRMHKDSLIWVSISVASIEGMRVLITPDSIHVLDKLNRDYYVYPISYTEQLYKFRLSFDDVQRLLTGNLLFNSSRTYTPVIDSSASASKKVAWSDAYYESYTSYPDNTYRPDFTKLENKATRQRMEITYTDFDQVNAQNLARMIIVNLFYGKTPSRIELTYNSISTDPITDFPFVVPSSFERK